MHVGDKLSLWGQFIAWVTAVISTMTLSDVGTYVGIISSLVMMVVSVYNQNKRTKLLQEKLSQQSASGDNLPDESDFNED